MGDVDDFNANWVPKFTAIPKILIGQHVRIPTKLNYDNEPEPVLCSTCVEAYAHACFIINGIYILKIDDAIKEARRLRWKQE